MKKCTLNKNGWPCNSIQEQIEICKEQISFYEANLDKQPYSGALTGMRLNLKALLEKSK